ncbi:hypothetical protein Poli38472_008358 [Pythium oligandrum]|uniref:RING-type domain-containing protein n=1 Tax=Pythium oligandrum TaxID=41045 RepID=A0A8K1FK69_PYTOL|nr:hypothetical protein Poli38472_008358 [Pythium oligandrum]|eukprot:TMW65716.1 hypothetical protein Poli38472_008358 [Pythium oligandrum]
MKFGKRMRSLVHKPWEDDYVDYKQLKKAIKALLETANEDASTVFLTALRAEIAQLNGAHARIYCDLRDNELRALQRDLGNRWVLKPAQARALLLGAIELSSHIDAFRRFVMLNSLAIVKITKKFDKLVASEHEQIKDGVLEELKQQSFYESESMDQLCEAARALTDRLMLCILPDGNFKMSQHHVSCPICLQTEVKSPVSLSCKHTFCWSCLSRAAEHRFNSCPLCRMEQSIDPRDYAIDGLLMRFKRAYDFVETGLDRSPFASSPMRQILLEGFELVNAHLSHVEQLYAALSPRSSISSQSTHAFSAVEDKENIFMENMMDTKEICVPDVKMASSPTSSDELSVVAEALAAASMTTPVFAKGDPVEVHYNNQWYPGMILHPNDDSETYSVLWWMEDASQRCGQRMPAHLLREADASELEQSPYVLFDFAAGAWKTATAWALGPFRRLSSPSDSGSITSNAPTTV